MEEKQVPAQLESVTSQIANGWKAAQSDDKHVESNQNKENSHDECTTMGDKIGTYDDRVGKQNDRQTIRSQ